MSGWHVHDSPMCNPAAFGHVMGKGGKVRRVLANRQSAQRSRIRKLQHISELETTLEALQHDIYKLSPQLTKLEAKQAGGCTLHGLPSICMMLRCFSMSSSCNNACHLHLCCLSTFKEKIASITMYNLVLFEAIAQKGQTNLTGT